jgi:putative transposase
MRQAPRKAAAQAGEYSNVPHQAFPCHSGDAAGAATIAKLSQAPLRRHRAEHDLGRRHDGHAHKGRVASSGRRAGPVARRVVGWPMDVTQATTLPMAALSMALAQRKPKAGLIFHSDQGTVYRSHDYRKLLQANGLRPSMSCKGNCWDNAVAESFFSNLKNEAMHDRLFSSRAEGKAVVGDYIETYCNQQRLHQTLGYQTPAAVEAAHLVLK